MDEMRVISMTKVTEAGRSESTAATEAEAEAEAEARNRSAVSELQRVAAEWKQQQKHASVSWSLAVRGSFSREVWC